MGLLRGSRHEHDWEVVEEETNFKCKAINDGIEITECYNEKVGCPNCNMLPHWKRRGDQSRIVIPWDEMDDWTDLGTDEIDQ